MLAISHIKSVVIQSLSHVRLFVTQWMAAHQTSLSFTISPSLLKFMSTESVMPSYHLILYYPLLLLPSIFPGIRIFSNESALYIRWPKYWTSASVLPMNIQSWFPLELTDLISLQSKWLTRVFSNTPHFESMSSSARSLLCGPSLTSVRDHWKNHSFDYTDYCWQSDVSAFFFFFFDVSAFKKKTV